MKRRRAIRSNGNVQFLRRIAKHGRHAMEEVRYTIGDAWEGARARETHHLCARIRRVGREGKRSANRAADQRKKLNAVLCVAAWHNAIADRRAIDDGKRGGPGNIITRYV